MVMKKSKSIVIADAVCGVLMLLSIFVYIIIGLTTAAWHPWWIIIVGAALISGVISIVFKTRAELKGEKQEDEPKKFSDM